MNAVELTFLVFSIIFKMERSGSDGRLSLELFR